MNPSTSTVTAGIDLGGTGTRIIIRGEEGTISTRTVPTVLFSNIEQSQRAGRWHHTCLSWSRPA